MWKTAFFRDLTPRAWYLCQPIQRHIPEDCATSRWHEDINDYRTPLQDKKWAALFIARPTVFSQRFSMSLGN
jgi:hypothetical protein